MTRRLGCETALEGIPSQTSQRWKESETCGAASVFAERFFVLQQSIQVGSIPGSR